MEIGLNDYANNSFIPIYMSAIENGFCPSQENIQSWFLGYLETMLKQKYT